MHELQFFETHVFTSSWCMFFHAPIGWCKYTHFNNYNYNGTSELKIYYTNPSLRVFPLVPPCRSGVFRFHLTVIRSTLVTTYLRGSPVGSNEGKGLFMDTLRATDRCSSVLYFPIKKYPLLKKYLPIKCTYRRS